MLVSGRSETSSRILLAAVFRNGLHFRAIAAIAEVYLSLRKRGMPDNISRLEFCDQEMRHGTDDVLKFNAVGTTKQDTYIIHLTDEYSDLTHIATLSRLLELKTVTQANWEDKTVSTTNIIIASFNK